MTEQEKREIAENFLRGLRNQDGSLLRSIMADDVVWSLPGESLMSGEARGVDAILKRAATLVGLSVKIELEYVIFGLHDVAVQLHNTGRSDGRCSMNTSPPSFISMIAESDDSTPSFPTLPC